MTAIPSLPPDETRALVEYYHHLRKMLNEIVYSPTHLRAQRIARIALLDTPRYGADE